MVTLINPVELKLKGNEFKLLQFLKTIDHEISYRQLSENLHISDRQLRDLVRVLHGFYIIEIEKVKKNPYIVNKYIINPYEKWTLQ